MKMKRTLSATLAVSASLMSLGVFATQAQAQANFPEKPVTFVVPFAPGGSNDIVARQLGMQLSELWGQPVVIENRAGGGATIGSAYTAAQPADGYTIMIASVTFTMNAAVQTGLPYDSRADFTPIAMVGQVPLVIGARPNIPATDPAGFVDYLRQNAGKLSYGSTGVGSIQHFAGEMFNQAAGTDVQVVQYSGGGPAMTDVMGGHIEYSIGSLTQMLPQMKAGNIAGIAVTSMERSPAAPEVPTLHESGFENFEVIQWWGVLGPAGIPDDVVAKLNSSINTVLATDTFAQFLATDGGTPRPMAPGEFAEFVGMNFDRWAQVAEAANIREQ
jgi:tripartite-type tricarboxylate transporter receptor subunit TctC